MFHKRFLPRTLQAYDALDFDMYIGEVNMTPNMSIPFFRLTVEGVYSDAARAYRSFAAGELSITDYADAFREETPFMPLLQKGSSRAKLVGATEASRRYAEISRNGAE